ncbi:hypothetical protein ACU9ZA_004831 [Klebsiella pneumoniae]
MLTIWAESPEEARNFIRNIYSKVNLPIISGIRVAKKNPSSRGNNYVAGSYYIATNDEHVDVTNELIQAPQAIVELVQWCTCDIMISVGDHPVCVIEDTTHIVRMNVFQRVPRIIKAAQLGVHAIILQGKQGLDLNKRGDNWAIYRYMLPYQKANKIYPTLIAPVLYLPNDEDQCRAEMEVANLLATIFYAPNLISDKKLSIGKNLDDIVLHGFNGNIAPPINSIRVSDKEVVVKIGARPERASWRSKGSGQMDPYIGMIAAAKYAYCFDHAGNKTRDLVVEFTFLPDGFFYFTDWESSTSLYKRLAFEIADKVVFCG